MRTPALRRLAVPALAALVLVGATGCSDDGGDDGAATTSTTAADAAPTTGGEDPATTAGDEGAATTAPGDEDGPGSTETQPGGSGPDTTVADQDGAGAPDEEAPDVSWDLNAAQYRGDDGTRIAYLCPPDGEIGSVWGTGTYTDDSSVCSAAVHAGLINPVEGGRVVVEIAPGEESYEGSEANGVTSSEYGEYAGSFTFPVG